MRKPYPTDLSDAEWSYIEPHMPVPKEHGRPRIHSLREILNATFYVLRSGCQWRMLPHDFPRWPLFTTTSENGASMVLGKGSRSEEHTSELQSRQYLVCRLLLEKKKYTSILSESYSVSTLYLNELK